jgi:hypothetical protein
MLIDYARAAWLLSLKRSGRFVHFPALQSVLPALRTQRLAAAVRLDLYSWSPPFIALRALVPSGLACVLARPLYDEAQTAIWVARWAKLPKAARRRLITQRRAANFLKFNGVG